MCLPILWWSFWDTPYYFLLNESVSQAISVFSTQNTHISVCVCLYLYVCVLGYFSKRNAILLEYQYMLLFDRVCGAPSRHGPCCCTSPGKDTVRQGGDMLFPSETPGTQEDGRWRSLSGSLIRLQLVPACRMPDSSQVTGQA